jgi:hypothetical protein
MLDMIGSAKVEETWFRQSRRNLANWNLLTKAGRMRRTACCKSICKGLRCKCPRGTNSDTQFRDPICDMMLCQVDLGQTVFEC